MSRSKHGLIVTGASGTIGSIVCAALAGAYRVVGLDVAEAAAFPGAEFVRASVRDERVLTSLFDAKPLVVHLASDQQSGWEGLLEVDILGTKTVLDAAAACGVPRVVVASSNHVVGGFESDRLAGLGNGAEINPQQPLRPDSEYAVAKAFGEAYGRLIAETTSTCVSCLRIGTVRAQDSPAAYLSAPEFEYIPGGPEGVERRLAATWLRHEDLLGIVEDELRSTDRFRLRFAVSDSEARFWSLDVLRWNRATYSASR